MTWRRLRGPRVGRVPAMHATPGLLADFPSLTTHHSVTGSMLHVLRHAGLEVSEDLLLGLGAGVGFFYSHRKGAVPMLLGRGNAHRTGTPGLVVDTARRLGAHATQFLTTSAKKAATTLQRELDAGRPSMVQVDMGFLPYFDFPEDYHFGGHVVVVAGETEGDYWVADRDEVLHRVPAADLAAARGSNHEPFPPRHLAYRLHLERARAPREDDVREAIAANADAMLNGPITNVGVRGIRKAARLIPGWKRMLSPEELAEACLHNFLFIDQTGGTGGGLFRTMYGRFLHEAADLLGRDDLGACAVAATGLGAAWDDVAGVFGRVRDGESPEALGGLKRSLTAIAGEEEALWTTLAAAVD